MAISAEQLNIILAAKDKEFAKAMAANSRRIEKFAQKANKDLSGAGDMFGKLAVAAQGLAAVAVFQQLATSVKAAADRMGDLADAADSIGITTTALQELRYAAQMSGIQQDTLQQALVVLSKNLGDAAGGGSAAKDSLQALGLSATDLASVPLPNALEMIANKIAAVENPMQRATLAADLFGKSGVKMINMLSEGSDGLAKMREEAQSLGVVIDEDIIRQAADAGDKLDAMSSVISANLSVALINLAPILIETAQAIAGLTAAANDFLFGQMNADRAFVSATEYAKGLKGEVQEVADAYSEVGKTQAALARVRDYEANVASIPDSSILANAEAAAEAAKANLVAVTNAHKDQTEVIELETIVIEDNTKAQGRSTAARQKSTAAMDAYRAQVEALGLTLSEFESISSTIQSSMENSFMGIVDGTMSAKDAFRSMAADIIKELYRVLVVQRLVGSFATATTGGSGLLGAIGNALKITGSASGGALMAGQPSVVGEHGRELFVPSSAGRVLSVPQAKAAVNGGGGVTVVQNINVSTGVQQTVRAEIKSLMPQIADSAKAAVFDAQRRSVNGMGFA
jgi:DNA-binding Xre family transcriptional regulator